MVGITAGIHQRRRMISVATHHGLKLSNQLKYSATTGDYYQLDFDVFVDYRVLGNHRPIMHRQDGGRMDWCQLNRAENSGARLTLNLDHSVGGGELDPHRYPLIPSRL